MQRVLHALASRALLHETGQIGPPERSLIYAAASLYQTTTLLIIAYSASSLPTNARVLVGAVSQLQPSLRDAAARTGPAPRSLVTVSHLGPDHA